MVARSPYVERPGTVTAIKQIVEIAHARGIPVLVDGSQGAVHKKVDVQDLGVDFYVFTGHKLYGPTGIGVLYGRYELLADMQPFNGGGEMIDVVTRDTVTYNEPPHRSKPARRPSSRPSGSAPPSNMSRPSATRRWKRRKPNSPPMRWSGSAGINSLRLIGTAPGKGGIFSFELKGAHAHDVSTILDRYGIAVRAGTHCAMPLLQRFGVTFYLSRLVRPIYRQGRYRRPGRGHRKSAQLLFVRRELCRLKD